MGETKAYPNSACALSRKEAADVLGEEETAVEDRALSCWMILAFMVIKNGTSS